MAQTFFRLAYHGVFSTKNRAAMLTDHILPELVKVVGGIIRDRDGALLAMNGTANHIHLLAMFHPKRAVSDMFRDVKSVSTDWVHAKFPTHASFAWQSGYGVFSVSESAIQRVTNYIEGQTQHHQTISFEDELLALLERHGIKYDLKYVFD